MRHGHAERRTITHAGLADWRKLGQGLHARFVLDDFAAGARFVAAIAEAVEAAAHDPEVRMGAVAAGAVIVDDSQAPGFVVLADPDGNKACVGTFQPSP